MSPDLRVGLKGRLEFSVPTAKMVSHLFVIFEGTHERVVIDVAKFDQRLASKRRVD
ncbi:MAG TPA: hypothetical protein VFR86_12720 [Burkholderiaceae bacterium]|nr:hypothetical protein [Burkholderiaceae bacterium]